MVWNLFSFKGDFSFGKSQKLQGATSGLQGGWVTWVIWHVTKKFCMRHDAWAGALLWWSCQSPVAHSCGLLNHLNSFCRGMFRLNAKLDAGSLFYSLSQFECDGHTVHMLTRWRLTRQWNHHCSHMNIPVHSPWLPGYIDVTQTILVMLTMAGLFNSTISYDTWIDVEIAG